MRQAFPAYPAPEHRRSRWAPLSARALPRPRRCGILLNVPPPPRDVLISLSYPLIYSSHEWKHTVARLQLRGPRFHSSQLRPPIHSSSPHGRDVADRRALPQSAVRRRLHRRGAPPHRCRRPSAHAPHGCREGRGQSDSVTEAEAEMHTWGVYVCVWVLESRARK
jgi:hypothetical protein